MSSSPFPTLDPYGWNSSIHLPSGTTPARVIRHDGSTLTVQSPTGPEVVANSVRIEPPPTVGDWLALQEGRIVEVLRQAGFPTDKVPYEGRLAPDVPSDAYWAFGYGNQYIAVVPSEGVVAVRLGARPATPDRVTFDGFTGDVLEVLGR